METTRCNTWSRTIEGLAGYASLAQEPRRKHAAPRRDKPCMGSGGDLLPHIQVLDHPDSKTLVISWLEPGAVNYGYQLWTHALARIPGVCAMSGTLIAVGTPVYMPRWGRGTKPLNAGRMISQACIRATVSAESQTNTASATN